MSPVANPGIVNAWMSRARAAEPVHGLGGDDQRVGRVEPAADADDDLAAWPMAVQPLLEPGDLDVVGLVAVEREPLAGRRARTGSGRPCGAARCRRSAASSSNSTVRNCATRSALVRRLSSKRALPQPLLPEPVEVDVGDGAYARSSGNRSAPRPAGRRTRRPSSGRPSYRSVVDSPWPAAAKTYAALQRALALRTSSRRSSARATVIGLPDRLASTVAPASDGLGARRDRHPHVLADLDVQREVRDVGGA